MQLDAVHAVVAVCGLGSCRVTETLVYAALKVQDNLVLVKGEHSICADTIKQTLQVIGITCNEARKHLLEVPERRVRNIV